MGVKVLCGGECPGGKYPRGKCPRPQNELVINENGFGDVLWERKMSSLCCLFCAGYLPNLFKFHEYPFRNVRCSIKTRLMSQDTILRK